MDYYEKKKTVVGIIDKCIQRGVYTIQDIGLILLKTHGFSEFFAQKYVNQGVLRGDFTQDKKTGIIKLVPLKKAQKEEIKAKEAQKEEF